MHRNDSGRTTLLTYRSSSLQERQRAEWGDKVQLLFGDMRTLNVPEQVDILVSELLGSFGDNELSPECLDGAMRFLKRKSVIRSQWPLNEADNGL